MFNINPKKMQEMMKQLGMSQESIPSNRVVIEKSDGKKIVIRNPNVTKMNVQGQEMFQISGNKEEILGEMFSEEDVKTVVEKTGCSEDDARSALNGSKGDLAEAIMNLSGG